MGLRVGLTGGVGAGKSTVAALLAARGAVVIDADAIAREVVEPGTPGLAAVVEHFGDTVLGPDGALDRPKVASIVFADEDQRQALNAIVHPLVGARMGEIMAAADPAAVVVWDVPLMVENGSQSGFDLVVVVEAALDVRLRRLADRGMDEADARARMARQATDEQRRAIADVVVPNGGSRDDLEAAVDGVWATIEQRAGEASTAQ